MACTYNKLAFFAHSNQRIPQSAGYARVACTLNVRDFLIFLQAVIKQTITPLAYIGIARVEAGELQF